jgi:hypothetical protein
MQDALAQAFRLQLCSAIPFAPPLADLQHMCLQTVGGGPSHDTGALRQPPSQYTVTEAVDYIGMW